MTNDRTRELKETFLSMLPSLEACSLDQLLEFDSTVRQHLSTLLKQKRQQQHNGEQQPPILQRNNKIMNDNIQAKKEYELEQIRMYLRDEYIHNVHFYRDQRVVYPVESNGIFAGYNEQNCADIDDFLFPTDDDFNELDDMGIISKHYCGECGSKNIRLTNFISHSLGKRDLDFIFSDKVLGNDLSDQVICDVGSRYGSILYYACLFTNAKRIMGIELNDKFVNLQLNTIANFNLNSDDDERVVVYHADFLKCAEIVKQCDILIMHNVFEWFTSRSNHIEIWRMLRFEGFFKKGTKLVTVPSIRQTLRDCGLDESELRLDDWLRYIPLDRYGYLDNGMEEEHSIHLYEVL